MKIEVSTTNYEFSHGKKPRGFGTWAFESFCNDGIVTVWHRGAFADAKRLAIADAKCAPGAFLIRVGA